MVLFFKILERTFKKFPMNSTRIYDHILISHLDNTLSIWKKATINSIIVYSCTIRMMFAGPCCFKLLYYPELIFPVLVVKLIGSPLLDLSVDFFVCNFGISLEI